MAIMNVMGIKFGMYKSTRNCNNESYAGHINGSCDENPPRVAPCRLDKYASVS